jgi:toxin ParE1/3/4
MQRRVVFVRRARRQLTQQLAFVAERNPAAARRLRDRLEAAKRQIAEFPRNAPIASTPGTRRLIVAPYILTYRERGQRIEILDVRHERQAGRPIPEDIG